MNVFKNLIKVISKQTKKFMTEDMGLVIKNKDIIVRKLAIPLPLNSLFVFVNSPYSRNLLI